MSYKLGGITIENIKPKYLVMVTASANNNKYYRMIPHGDSWTAEYGRVGGSPQRREYSLDQWNKKYREKVNKGYVDQSDLVKDLISVQPKKESKYKPIDNSVIAEIVERLQQMAHKAISDNYTVSSNKVTQAMIDEAQEVLTELTNITELQEFNDTLLNLFTVIPRKMSTVSYYLAQSKDDYAKIIKREQDLLDVMSGQVFQKNIEDTVEEVTEEKEPVTLLEALGLVFEECDQNDIAKIKSALGSCENRFYRAWRVKNLKTNNRFEKFVKDEGIVNRKLLWHGSRNENWWSIINTGLLLKPTNAIITGKLYGNGIYFAPKARKSLGYTSLNGSYWARGHEQFGFMALMDVAYGIPYDVYNFDSKYYNLNYSSLQDFQKDANCLHAHAGANIGYTSLKNDEIVIYKEEQCTIRYLVELK